LYPSNRRKVSSYSATRIAEAVERTIKPPSVLNEKYSVQTEAPNGDDRELSGIDQSLGRLHSFDEQAIACDFGVFIAGGPSMPMARSQIAKTSDKNTIKSYCACCRRALN
jgi:hypothetical protein